MKKLITLFLLLLFLLIPITVFSEDYKAYYIPWIVTNEVWWGGININNRSDVDNTITITDYNEEGKQIFKDNIVVLANENYRWVIEEEVRSVLIETNNKVFVTAFQGREDGGVTLLKIEETTTVKN